MDPKELLKIITAFFAAIEGVLVALGIMKEKDATAAAALDAASAE